MSTVVYSLVSIACSEDDSYWVKPTEYYPSRKRKRMVRNQKHITGCLRLSPTGVCIRIKATVEWDVRFRRASKIEDSKLIKCVLDDEELYADGSLGLDEMELFNGHALNEWATEVEARVADGFADFPPRRQLRHAREGDIGLWSSPDREGCTLFVFRNNTVFARDCWRLLARHVRFTRPIALYIQELAVVKSCAPNGATRAQDLARFVAEFA